MASWQAYLVSFLARRFVKEPFKRAPNVMTMRKVFNASAPSVPRGCVATQENMLGVSVECVTANANATIGTLLYLHGGAFVAGSPKTHRPITGWFAKKGWRVFAPAYRLAPEHRFPAQIEDAIAVYRNLLDSGVYPKQLVVAGDSAGGNLALSLCLSLRNLGLPQPAALALFSPVTDFTWSGESILSNTDRCAMFSHTILPIGGELYLGNHDPRDPLASPVYADLKGLPPMLFHVGDDEILRDDSVRVADNAKRAGIEVEIKIWPVVPHVWQIMHQWIPEGRESLRIVDDFLLRHIASKA